MTDDIRKLLGGYATGTLTEDERKALFEAALHDETLFAAMAEEQVLKDLLDDSSARAQLLHAVENPRFSAVAVLREWFERPRSKVLVAVGAIVLLTVGIKETVDFKQRREQSAETVAVLREAPAPRHEAAPPPVEIPAARQQAAVKKQSTPRKEEALVAPPAAPVIAEARKPEMQQGLDVAPPTVALERSYRAAAAPPPPQPMAKEVASSDGATRVAMAGDIQMKYTVLLRNAQGEYQPVPVDHEFAATDRARLRVEVNRSGILGVQGSDDKPVFVRNVTPGSPVVVPADFEFQQASSHQVEISFHPTPETDVAMNMADRQKSAVRGVSPPAASGVAAMRASDPAPGSVSVRLNLRRKL